MNFPTGQNSGNAQLYNKQAYNAQINSQQLYNNQGQTFQNQSQQTYNSNQGQNMQSQQNYNVGHLATAPVSNKMSSILGAYLGEASSEIRVSFKKTIMIKDYQPEVFELETTVKVDKGVVGVERNLIASIALAQLEYSLYEDLYQRNLILEATYKERIIALENAIDVEKAKYMYITGKMPDHIIR